MPGRAVVLVMAALVAACQSPQTRINRNQAAFDSFPPPVQAAIREGRAEVGFTEQQVLMALGKPDHVYALKTEDAEREVWQYGYGAAPSVGVGVGLTTYHLRNGTGSAYGSSVGMTSDVPGGKHPARYVFEEGRVVAVERREW